MTTLKQLKTVFNFAKKHNRPLLTRIAVEENSMKITDLETFIEIKDNFGLENGFYDISTIGLTSPLEGDFKDYPLNSFEFELDSLYKLNITLDKLVSFFPFTSKDETRISLNSVAIKDNHLVATNGYILKFEELENKSEFDFTMSRSSFVILSKLMKKYKLKEVEILLNEEYFVVNHDKFNFNSRLIVRDYPKWKAIVPTKFNNSFIIDKWIDIKELKPLFDRNKGVKIELDKGKVVLTIAKHDKKYNIGYCDSKMKETIGFNAGYLNDCIEKNKEVKINFNNEFAPFLIGENNIGMPLKI